MCIRDSYQITERIGIGGMAEVYRAQDNVLGRLVAVKVMLPQYAADPNFTQRFKQEAAAAANLQSPYIVNVYDWGQDEGTYYIVMEFVRGSDLKTAIIERGAINQRKVAEIGSQVCQALSVAHGLDIIHRDIKPQNIMVQPDGNIKVMDFGIARAKNSQDVYKRQSPTPPRPRTPRRSTSSRSKRSSPTPAARRASPPSRTTASRRIPPTTPERPPRSCGARAPTWDASATITRTPISWPRRYSPSATAWAATPRARSRARSPSRPSRRPLPTRPTPPLSLIHI